MRTVGLDVDGVLLCWRTGFSQVVKERYGIPLTGDDFEHWRIRNYPTLQELECTPQDIDDLLDEYLNLSTGTLVDSNTPDVLAELREEFHVEIRTNRVNKYRMSTFEALAEHGIHFEGGVFDNVTPKQGYDALVDDFPGHAITNVASGGVSLLFDQPWNTTVQLQPGMHRVHSFQDIANKLRAIAGA